MQRNAASNPASDAIVQISLLVIVIMSFLLSIAFAAIGIVVSQRLGSILSDVQRLANFAHIIVYVVCPAACFFGIYAIVRRKTLLISFYVSFLVGQLFFTLITGSLCLYVFYHIPTFSWNKEQCLVAAHDSFTIGLCQRGPLLKGVATAFLVVIWLVEFGMIFLGNAFLNKLHEEDLRMEMFDPKYYDNDARNC